MFFSAITKNLNLKFLTKNLVTFIEGSMKIFVCVCVCVCACVKEGFTKNQYTGEDCLKRRAWTVSRFKRGPSKKEWVCFLREG